MALGFAKSDLAALSQTRLEEAQALLERGFFSGAYYLCGYAVEFALKARIAAAFQADVIPVRGFVNKIYTHDLAELVRLAELQPMLVARLNEDPEFARNWTIAADWSEESRYRVTDRETVGALVAAVGEPEHGILEWIRTS